MFNISNHFLIAIPSLIIFAILSSSGQTFDPNVNDSEYLDGIEKRLQEESMVAQHVLVNYTKVLQQVTRTFIESKLKENLFKVVRERVEMELEEMARNSTFVMNVSSTPSSRQARQDDDDDEEVTKPPTPRPRPGLLPQLANVVTTLFGSDVNVTGYLKDATAFLPQDLSDRILSAASLIDPARFTSTTLIPPPLIINGQVVPQSALANGTFIYAQGAQPQGVQPANLGDYQNINVGSQPINTNNIKGLQPVDVGQVPTQGQPSFNSQSSNNGGVVQQNTNNNGAGQQIVAPSPLVQPGTVQQQQSNFNVGTNGVSVSNGVSQLSTNGVPQLSSNGVPQLSSNGAPQLSSNGAPQFSSNGVPQFSSNGVPQLASNGVSQLSSNAAVANPVPNFKVNDILIAAPAPVFPSAATSSEDEEEDNNNESSEDELFARDDQSSPGIGYIDEYPAVKYVIRIFNHFTSGATVPTTTEYYNTTTVERTLDSLEEEESRATSPATSSRYKQVVQGGLVLYEGAREAYHLLQNLNKYLDRVGDRVDQLGYGPEDVGIEL